MSEKMRLCEWVTDEAMRLAAFDAWWKQQHAANPERFPLEMSAGMWDEAFLTFDPEQADSVARAKREEDERSCITPGMRSDAEFFAE